MCLLRPLCALPVHTPQQTDVHQGRGRDGGLLGEILFAGGGLHSTINHSRQQPVDHHLTVVIIYLLLLLCKARGPKAQSARALVMYRASFVHSWMLGFEGPTVQPATGQRIDAESLHDPGHLLLAIFFIIRPMKTTAMPPSPNLETRTIDAQDRLATLKVRSTKYYTALGTAWSIRTFIK